MINVKDKNRRRCKCGCGKLTNYGAKYIWGHNCKIEYSIRKMRKICRRCKCGCGGITNPGRKYIKGHNSNQKGLKRSKETKRKLSVVKSGENHPFYNKHLSKEHRRKLSLANGGKTKIRRRCKCGCGGITNYGKKYISGHNSLGRKYSKETRRKISLGLMGNTIWLGKHHSEKSKLKNSLSTTEYWKDPSFQKKQYKARNIKPNRPEIKLGEILNKFYPNEYKYVGDFQFWLGGKNPDFMNVNGQKKLIELYGDYWHAGEDEQDRIDHFKQYGFDTLIIWENELKKSRLQLRRKLKEFHIKTG